ncbi:hypothetical protein [Lachnotalea glycerini]|nr:hypothetical protein [Lachnotalea glycerini]
MKFAILQVGTVVFDTDGNKLYFPTEDEAVAYYRERVQESIEGGDTNE